MERTETRRKPRLAIVGFELPRSVSQGIAMRELFDLTLVNTARPLRDAAVAAQGGSDCVITRLRGDESVVDIHELVASAGATPILFLTPRLPVRAPLARVIRAAGDAILAETEPVAVLEATLVSLLSDRGRAHA